MSSEDDTLICASCGLDLRKSSAIRKNKHNLCPLCTSNGTKEPKFENIVYGLAIGYFMNKKEITDPIEALYSAHTFVSQLPYWQDTVQSPPPLERLNEARMITLGVAQEAEERQLPGFFISYSRTKATQNIVKPLKTALEAYGYRVWDEADKKLIEQTQFCVLILSQTYFTSREGKDELEIILTIKDPKYVFPVWLKDLEDKEMTPLEQEKMEKTKKIMGTGWNEWKGDIEELTNRLVKRAQYALGLQNYNNIPLIAIEAQLLKELEKLVGEPIPFLKKKDLESAKFGFYAEKNRIEGLKLVERRLTSLPSTIGQCLALRTLDLADNDLHTLPESFGNLNNLEELNLHANWLSSLPESFFRLSKLRKVRLAGNQLKTLPPSFRTTHKHLRPQYPAVVEAEATVLALLELLIGKPVPQVTEIKKDTFGFTVTDNHVTGLKLNSQKLKSLPENFGNLKNLISLHLHSNQLSSLPESFGQLKNLQTLDLGWNQLDSLPEHLELRKLEWLNLCCNELVSLPDSFGNLINLKELILYQNYLFSLPEPFGQLTNLKELNLENNKLISLPETFGNLRNLQRLELQKNGLSSLPQSFGNLTRLEYLVLEKNLLSFLPESFGDLKNLKNLFLNENQLKSLPETFGNLINLAVLWLDINQLTALPKNFGSLQNLKELFLDENPLNSLPESFRQLKGLKHLNIDKELKKDSIIQELGLDS